MAEYKQYITQEQENGSVMISEDVVSTIAAHAVADVEGVVGIITKPGGLTVTEALCKKLPMILVNPIPGHEERNVEFLMNNGAALRVSHNFSVCEAVYYLYTNPERLTLMSRCIELIAKPDAAQRICDLAESICAK